MLLATPFLHTSLVHAPPLGKRLRAGRMPVGSQASPASHRHRRRSDNAALSERRLPPGPALALRVDRNKSRSTSPAGGVAFTAAAVLRTATAGAWFTAALPQGPVFHCDRVYQPARPVRQRTEKEQPSPNKNKAVRSRIAPPDGFAIHNHRRPAGALSSERAPKSNTPPFYSPQVHQIPDYARR